jgi:hypothetical protein
MKFFGRAYPSMAYFDSEQARTPVGEPCGRCKEPIAATDDGWMIPSLSFHNTPSQTPMHRECFMRCIVGSVAHQQFKCGCFVNGSACHDDPALSVRDGARAALDYYEAQHGR